MKYFVAFALLLWMAGVAQAADRPNILWLVSEDNGRFLGCYADPIAKTPTLDNLARNGLLYERCFTQPVCAPSRFGLISGLYPVACGPAQHMRASGKVPANLKGFPSYLREMGYFTSNNAKTDYNAPIAIKETWDASGRQAHWRNRSPSQPFFSVFNHEVTHESCLFPEKEKLLFKPADMRVPPYQPDTPEVRADWARYYTRMTQMDGQIADKLKELADAGLAEDTIIFYFSDNGGVLPRSKRFLHESGTHVPLILYFPPKWQHLSPAPPGTRIKEPVHFVDFAPTVLSLVSGKISDYMQGHPFAGPLKQKPNAFVVCSRDRMDERYDMMRSVVDERWLYIRNYRPDLPYVQPLNYMFKARGYQSWGSQAREGKLTAATAMFWGAKPSEELYDTLADPDNIHNLASDPKQQETLTRMRAALRDWVVGNRDNGFVPEGSVLEGFDASHVAGAFPVDQVFELANLASDRQVANLPQFIDALDDPSEPIRWWGAQGCTMLGSGAASAEEALRQRMLKDPSGAVQVAAAEAMARLGQVDDALPILVKWTKQADSPAFALQAANVLDRLGELARPALPSMKEVMKAAAEQSPGAEQYLVRILTHTVDVLEGREEPLVYPAVAQSP